MTNYLNMIGPPPISSITRLVFIQNIQPTPHDLQVSQTFSAHTIQMLSKSCPRCPLPPSPLMLLAVVVFHTYFAPKLDGKLTTFSLTRGEAKTEWAGTITHYRDLVLPSTIFSTKHPTIHSASMKRTAKDTCYQQRKETLEFNSRK